MGEHMTKIQHADKKAQQTQQQKDVGYGALFKIRQISSNKKLPVILCWVHSAKMSQCTLIVIIIGDSRLGVQTGP